MARNSGNNGNTGKVSGKVRFILLDAEINEGNITDITQAIAGALRPATIIQQVITPLPVTPAIEGTNGNVPNAILAGVSLPEVEDVAEAQAAPAAPNKQPRDRNDRKPFQGKVLSDLNWDNGDVPFVKFVEAKNNPKTNIGRYLTVATWLKRYHNLDVIGANHVYNGYLKAGWKLMVDMGATFRKGAENDKRYFESKGNGNYAVTPFGSDEADKMGKEKAKQES